MTEQPKSKKTLSLVALRKQFDWVLKDIATMDAQIELLAGLKETTTQSHRYATMTGYNHLGEQTDPIRNAYDVIINHLTVKRADSQNMIFQWSTLLGPETQRIGRALAFDQITTKMGGASNAVEAMFGDWEGAADADRDQLRIELRAIQKAHLDTDIDKESPAWVRYYKARKELFSNIAVELMNPDPRVRLAAEKDGADLNELEGTPKKTS